MPLSPNPKPKCWYLSLFPALNIPNWLLFPTSLQAAQTCLTLTWQAALRQLNDPRAGANCLRMAFHGETHIPTGPLSITLGVYLSCILCVTLVCMSCYQSKHTHTHTDAGTYSMLTDTGGANGSILNELNFNTFPQNNGLTQCPAIIQVS